MSKMYIKDCYTDIVNEKKQLMRVNTKGTHMTLTKDYELLTSTLAKYRKLILYVIADVDGRASKQPPLTEHPHLKFNVSNYGVGYIDKIHGTNRIYKVKHSPQQINGIKTNTIKVLELSIKLMTNVKLVDYVGRSNKFDYESVMTLLQSVTDYTKDINELLLYNTPKED